MSLPAIESTFKSIFISASGGQKPWSVIRDEQTTFNGPPSPLINQALKLLSEPAKISEKNGAF